MSGIIDEKGVQWEHCNQCGRLVRLSNLGYLPPNKVHKHGLDLCIDCVNGLSQSMLRKVQPAIEWKAVQS